MSKGFGFLVSGIAFMQLLLGSPRDGSTTPRGGPAFTPRGTLVALSELRGNRGAALALGTSLGTSLGKPLAAPHGTSDGVPSGGGKQAGLAEQPLASDTALDLGFAKEWVEKMFATPREGQTRQRSDQRSDAVRWLQDNFGAEKGTAVGGFA